MDITKQGWKCDICEKEYFEQDYGFNAKYSVEIAAYQSINSSSNNEYTEVCCDCIEKIQVLIGQLEEINTIK